MSYLAYVTICGAVIYLLILGVSAIIRPAGTARFLGAFAQTLPAHVLELVALMPWRLHRRFARWSVPLAARRMRLLGVGAAVAGLVVLYALIVPKADSEVTEAPTVIRVISVAPAE